MFDLPSADCGAIFRCGANCNHIVRHGRKAGMHDFVVHGEQKNVMKITLKQRLQVLAALAVDVTQLALH